MVDQRPKITQELHGGGGKTTEAPAGGGTERLGQNLSRQLAILELSTKIQEQVGSELTKAQRDHFLRQQLKAIQDELGESENENPEIGEMWERIKKAGPPREVLREAERGLEGLAGMHPSSAEYSIVRTYLD